MVEYVLVCKNNYLNHMTESLKDTLADMSVFLTPEVGDTFEGVYKGFRRVPSRFDPEKETLELVFSIEGKEKTMTSMSLPKFLVEAKVEVGDYIQVKKVSKKGTTVLWSVEKKTAPPSVDQVNASIASELSSSDDQPTPNEADLKAAGL